MDDLVTRLREHRTRQHLSCSDASIALCNDAAAEIERLRTTQVELRAEMYGEVASRDAEIERLRAALLKIKNRYPCDTRETMWQVAKDALGDEQEARTEK
jgi:hypothetical protein